MAPSPRDGLQPVEFNDQAYYAVLGRDLAATGVETTLSASGFDAIPGLPPQAWYHWAEIWLASAVISLLGTAPMAARYFIVMPVVLLAAAALAGTLVRRFTRTNSRRAYMFGFIAFLLLAPVPLIQGPFFSSWAVGMIFGITLYGLGAVSALIALYSLAVLDRRDAWSLATFVGSSIAFILPAHIAVALLTLVGVAGVSAIRIIQTVIAKRRLSIPSPAWSRTLITAGVLILATVVWASLTGHSFGGASATPLVSPFNASWRESVAITALGAGAFLAIPAAWFVRRRTAPVQADVYLGTLGLLLAGAIGWGARLGEFTMFYLFFAGIAVIATPVAAIAVRSLFERLQATHHLRLAAGLVVLCGIQLAVGVLSATLRLQQFGPHDYEPMPVSLLGAIDRLPPNARLAYSCQPLDESGFGVPQLLSIDAHTARRVVPMCFEAELLSTLIGAPRSAEVPNLFFASAPQRALYPDAATDPSSVAVAAFLKNHGIDYIYADARHPNSLVEDAVSIAQVRDAEVLRVP
jgi:hypothetical protein